MSFVAADHKYSFVRMGNLKDGGLQSLMMSVKTLSDKIMPARHSSEKMRKSYMAGGTYIGFYC